jgi:hypothetical protein
MSFQRRASSGKLPAVAVLALVDWRCLSASIGFVVRCGVRQQSAPASAAADTIPFKSRSMTEPSRDGRAAPAERVGAPTFEILMQIRMK